MINPGPGVFEVNRDGGRAKTLLMISYKNNCINMSQGKKLPSDFWNKTFTEALKNNLGIVTHACTKTGVTPQCYYEYRLRNPAFGRKIDLIKERICLPVLEDLAQARAIKDNDRLLMFMLRNLGASKWSRDKVEEAMAKDEPRIRSRELNQKELIQQKIPTKAEQEAVRAFRKAIKKIRDGGGNLIN